MDVVLLSRLQFAAATYFHFLFVPLTLGLSLVLAVMETIYVKTGNVRYKTMTQFWGKLLPHQLCSRCSHWYYPRISVRH